MLLQLSQIHLEINKMIILSYYLIFGWILISYIRIIPAKMHWKATLIHVVIPKIIVTKPKITEPIIINHLRNTGKSEYGVVGFGWTWKFVSSSLIL